MPGGAGAASSMALLRYPLTAVLFIGALRGSAYRTHARRYALSAAFAASARSRRARHKTQATGGGAACYQLERCWRRGLALRCLGGKTLSRAQDWR